MRRQWRWIAATGFVLLFFFAYAIVPGFAAEGAEPNPAEEPVGTIFRWLNFLLVFGGLGYLVAKHGPAFFRARAEVISRAMTEAAAAKAVAEQQLREAQEKLQHLDEEIAELGAVAQREAAAEAARLHAATRDDIEKIARAARAEIEAAERAARVELKSIAARAAVARAGALLRKQMTTQTQARLFRSFVNDLSESVN